MKTKMNCLKCSPNGSVPMEIISMVLWEIDKQYDLDFHMKCKKCKRSMDIVIPKIKVFIEE